MTDEEKIEAITAKLSGQLCIGQRVRVCNNNLVDHGKTGVVCELHPPRGLGVQLDAGPTRNPRYYYATSLEPAP